MAWMKEIENQSTISAKNLPTLWKILLPFVPPPPFLLQCCCSHVTLQSHLNIAEGKGCAQGVSRIFGEDCGFKNFNLNLILTCNISLITLLVFFTGAVTVFLRDQKLLGSIKAKMVMSTKLSNVNSWSFNPHHNCYFNSLCQMYVNSPGVEILRTMSKFRKGQKFSLWLIYILLKYGKLGIFIL